MSEQPQALEGLIPEPYHDRLLATLLELVQIDSPSGHEAAVAARVEEMLSDLGLQVTFDGAADQAGSDSGNLIARLPASPGVAGRLYFSSHMDTAEPGRGIKPQVDEGVIRSDGETVLGGDDKVGIAAMVEMLRTLVETASPHPEIVLLLSVCEEVGLRGAIALDPAAAGLAFDGEPCFVLDADGEPGGVIIGAPYHVEFTMRFKGLAAHAGVRPEAGVSAVAMAAKAIAAMPLGRIDEMTTANVGTIQGGSANNVVAEACQFTGEVRSLEQARLDELTERIVACAEQAAAEAGGQVEIDLRQAYPGFKLDEDDPLVRLVLDTARGLGLPAQARYTGGGSDANILAGKGLRPLVLATGMTDVHSKAESLKVADLVSLTRLLLALVLGYQA